jgi:vacuolar-type H+-ATPase subunit E/Vma4
MLLSTATATSRSMQIAIDRAKTSARGDIAQQLETRLDELERQFSEELSQGDQSQLMQQFTQATEAVASQTLVGSRVRERKLAADGNEYRAWVLMEMPIGEARSALLDKINGDEEMRTRMRSTEVFNQLEEKVKNYENTKNK